MGESTPAREHAGQPRVPVAAPVSGPGGRLALTRAPQEPAAGPALRYDGVTIGGWLPALCAGPASLPRDDASSAPAPAARPPTASGPPGQLPSRPRPRRLAPSTNAPPARPATWASAAARTAISSAPASAPAGSARTARNPSPAQTFSPDITPLRPPGRAHPGAWRLRPRPAICGGCGQTHVLPPAGVGAWRADGAAVTGEALVLAAAGPGYGRSPGGQAGGGHGAGLAAPARRAGGAAAVSVHGTGLRPGS
jgi:hypothetical protein